jgi:hypothetical protein
LEKINSNIQTEGVNRMPRHKRKHKKLRKYAKKARHYYDNGVKIWKAVNTTNNKKKMASLGKRASKMQENILNMI